MKVTDRLKKVDDSLTINMYDNGYMVQITGRDSEDDWVTLKIMCDSLDKVNALVAEISALPKD
jgi:hypothetical protein